MPSMDHLRTDTFAQKRLYAVAVTIQHLLRSIDPTSAWAQRLADLLTTFPSAPGVTVLQTGFPQGWATLPLWR